METAHPVPGPEVLVIRLRSLGDMVLLTPALAALKAWRPELRLRVLAERAFAPVLEGNPDVEEVILRRGFLATALDLRARRFDAVFNQHGGPSSALLAAASGAPLRVCWPGKQFGIVYNALAPRPRDFLGRDDYHTVEERLVQFHAAGLPPGPAPPSRVYARREEVEAVRGVLAARGLPAREPYILIHPGANYPTKLWPMGRFAEAARILREERGLAPVVTLGPDDLGLLAEARAAFGPGAVILEGLGLRGLIALAAGAGLFVGCDSGPAHVAAAAGAPVVTVFGSSDERRWRPWTPRGRAVTAAGIACRPCRGKSCDQPEPRCILSVTVEQVVEACRGVLEGGEGA